MTTSNAPVVAKEPQNPTIVVENQIRTLISANRLHLPADYSAPNALREAWLVLQMTGAAEGCTKESVVNALHDMILWALSPGKKQIYFIKYGNKLTALRSYFGDVALAERLVPGLSVYSKVIYTGEKFKPKMISGKRGLIQVVDTHELLWPRGGQEIEGCYAGGTLVDPATGEIEELGIELMDIQQIKTSWKKSKSMGPNSFHNEQPDIACQRTVLRRWAKPWINRSSDALLMEAIRRQDDAAIEAEMHEEIEQNAGQEMLQVEEPKAIEPGELTKSEVEAQKKLAEEDF